MARKPDAEMAEFEASLLRSAKQAARGEYARVHEPADIVRWRRRPVGSTTASRKSATTIRLDEDILVAFKATGRGWQTRINNALKDWLTSHQLT
ncbi:BrnA antitoxin family protein [Achromobacter sp. MFA1 R4]|uniref:BrnA antitoxin family protein n=1 Tax=Achromobacter sp. MFA1 R4 TaxID=1881016 RepID=UPI0009537622|nr:BrnA antitoxin family protein [Achromobacter sp. MFA1 R4]SIT19315.1 BrnA antitoxin of type II toxin-antitoxin system [Achromobacter sp. MFA1 R4]